MSNTINTVNAQMIDELFTLTFNEIEKISKDLSVDLPHATTKSIQANCNTFKKTFHYF